MREGEKWTLHILNMKYGDVTGNGQDDAVVLTTCEFPNAANPGAYPRDILLYQIARGQPMFVTEFNPPRPNTSDLPPGVWEADLTKRSRARPDFR